MNGAPSAMVSPGLWGFVAFFVLALALYLLMRNMNARMRRMSYRSEELRREAEGTSNEQSQGEPGGLQPGRPDADGDAEGDQGEAGEPRT